MEIKKTDDIIIPVIENFVKLEKSSLQSIFNKLANIGWEEARGRDCLAYSDNEDKAHEKLIDLAKHMGLDYNQDQFGNTYITYTPKGCAPDAPIVASGSHLDSVHNGGKFDGVLGVASALEAIRRIKCIEIYKDSMNLDFNLKKRIQVIAFRGEESSRFGKSLLGSSLATGTLDEKIFNSISDHDGKKLSYLIKYGKPSIDAKNYSAFFEIHIEQSVVIADLIKETNEEILGIVTGGIGGALRCIVEFQGEASHHTGGLPMNERSLRDMMLNTSRLIVSTYEIGKQWDKPEHPARATAKIIDIDNKAPNVVSGWTKAIIDVRALDKKIMYKIIEEIRDKIDNVKGQIIFSEYKVTDPVKFEEELPNFIRNIANKMEIKTINLPSMPGQDTISMAKISIPTGMIFIASENEGVSHNKREFSRRIQCEKATDLLTASMFNLALET